MTTKPTAPLTEVAITLIRRGPKKEQILAHFNPDWDAFTLPMTKRRRFFDVEADAHAREEDWLDAAARAAAEFVGRTCSPTPLLEDFLPEHLQSGRDGKWRLYRFRVFEVALRDGETIPGGKTVEWLTTDQILDQNRRPLSPTARHVIGYLVAEQIIVSTT